MNNTKVSTHICDQLIFGCGRLTGGVEKNNSINLINTAFDLGIRKFDIAPSYGDGQVEDILKTALGSRIKDAFITVKIGLPRTKSSPIKSIVKSILRPLVKNIKRGVGMNPSQQVKSNSVGNMNAIYLESSFNDIIEKLGVSYIDTVLLHEPRFENIDQSVILLLEKLRKTGKIKQYGTGTGQIGQKAVSIGRVMQFRYGQDNYHKSISNDIEVRLHGFFRNSKSDTLEQVYATIKEVLESNRNTHLVFSTRSKNNLVNIISNLGG